MTHLIEIKKYSTPDIVRIKIDQEISLALESTPPTGPNEVYYSKADQIIKNPFNNKMA